MGAGRRLECGDGIDWHENQPRERRSNLVIISYSSSRPPGTRPTDSTLLLAARYRNIT